MRAYKGRISYDFMIFVNNVFMYFLFFFLGGGGGVSQRREEFKNQTHGYRVHLCQFVSNFVRVRFYTKLNIPKIEACFKYITLALVIYWLPLQALITTTVHIFILIFMCITTFNNPGRKTPFGNNLHAKNNSRVVYSKHAYLIICGK